MLILDTIKGMNILKIERGTTYFKDENCRIDLTKSTIRVTLLCNAMQRGKLVKSLLIYHEDGLYCNEFEMGLYNYLKKMNITLIDLVNKIEFMPVAINPVENYFFSVEEKNSNTIFSPFFKPKNLKTIPSKWNKGHIIKAILTKQIIDGEITMNVTDDYKSDSDDNFDKGKKLDLMELCKDLVEHSSGWWFNGEKGEDEQYLYIGANCHQHRYNTLKFNKYSL